MVRTPACTRALVAAAAACLAALSCRENISAPGQCPALCPSSQVQVSDTTLLGVDTSDVAVRGFVTPAEGTILVAADLDSLKGRVLLRFVKRPTRFPVASDTVGVTIGGVDSATLDLRIARDTAVKNLRMLLYRLPASVDSNATFTSMTAYFADSMLIDSIRVDSIPGNDTLRFIALHHRFLPAALVEPNSSDSGVVAMGVGFRADARTAVTVSAVESGVLASARLKYYVHGVAPQDTLRHSFDLGPAFDTFVTNPVPAAPGAGLLVGNLPSARSIVRFNIPRFLIDSTTVVRATLVMSQLRSATGRPAETFTVEARPVISDYTGKSITHTDTTLYGRATVTVGDVAQLAFEVAPMLRFWGAGGDSLPRTILLRVRPEGGALGEVTLAGRTAGACTTGTCAPFLRVTFIRPYAFGVP